MIKLLLFIGLLQSIEIFINSDIASRYCKKKHDTNNRKDCYFWTCPYYNYCEYNGEDKKEE